MSEVTLHLKGEYRDTLLDRQGRVLARSSPARNVVVYRALDLIARLLSNEPGIEGVLYWAVGAGDPVWDSSEVPLQADRKATRLANEIYRKRLDAEQDIAYDEASKSLSVKVSFAPDEAVGQLREFGLFGGDATDAKDSGYLINYRIHAVMEKTADNSLARDLRITLGSDVMLDRLVDLIGSLLARRPGLQGIQYWAVGAGDPAWDANPPQKNNSDTKLAKEIYRKPVDTSRQVTYVEDTHTLLVRTTFDYNEAIGVLREFGLFGGDATQEAGTGYLLSHQVHTPLDKTTLRILEREFHLLLGSGVKVAVPKLTGLTREQAEAVLVDSALKLGEVHESEEEGLPGRVIKQEPASGTFVTEGTTISITLVLQPQVAVPEVRGLVPDEAEAVLKGVGLLLGEARMMEESEGTPGTIARQVPAAGNRVARSKTVNITLAIPFKTAVPDLRGLSIDAANIVLEEAGLKLAPAPHALKETDTDWETIVDQNPPAEAGAAVGSEVEITLAAPHTVEVPDLKSMTPDDAQAALKAAAAELLKQLNLASAPAGLALGKQTQQETTEVPDGKTADVLGRIVSQSPAAKERAALYSTVDVVVTALAVKEIPNLIGLELGAATAALKERSFMLGEVVKNENLAKSGTIFRQEPEAGARASAGTSVRVTVATPLLVEVPDLIGRTRAYALEVLSEANLVLAEPVRKQSTQPPGSIIEQKPAAGEKVPRGTSIQVTIVEEPRPTADAGKGRLVEYGKSFMLDGAGSKVAEGRKISKYIWTQLS